MKKRENDGAKPSVIAFEKAHRMAERVTYYINIKRCEIPAEIPRNCIEYKRCMGFRFLLWSAANYLYI
jgi:hypothetical protein